VDDRRISLRWSSRLPCRLEFEEEEISGEVVDLSFEGARVLTPGATPKAGSLIRLALRPDRENVRLKAMVIYVEDQHFGVKFQHTKGEAMKVLRPFFYA
jgi:hypothetical protein